MSTIETPEIEVGGIVPIYGSNRMLAPRVGAEFKGVDHITVGFAGGMCELEYFEARTINVNDIHVHIINLAMTAADPILGPKLYRAIRRKLFHPVELQNAQLRCIAHEFGPTSQELELFGTAHEEQRPTGDEIPNLQWAIDYFTVAWMTRHGSAGTPSEFKSGISTRWNANGGDSAAHFHGAVRSLPALMRRVLRRCNFTCMDVFDVIDRIAKSQAAELKKDPKKRSILGAYFDPPFPGPGDKYTHPFSFDQHRRMAHRLRELKPCRVVCRFYDHELIRDLYPRDEWTWIEQRGRKQTNGDAPEVLLINGPSYTERK